MAAAPTAAWPPPPAFHRLYGGPAGGPPPPPPPPPPTDTYTAFGVTHEVHPPPPPLHSQLLYNPAAPPGVELRRLNAALAVAHVELVSAVADGAAGYDEKVHVVAVLLQNMQHLLSGLREAQAADALCFELERSAAEKRGAALALRAAADAARAAGARVTAAEAEARREGE